MQAVRSLGFVAGYEFVNFYGGGDPTLWPGFLISKAGLAISMVDDDFNDCVGSYEHLSLVAVLRFILGSLAISVKD